MYRYAWPSPAADGQSGACHVPFGFDTRDPDWTDRTIWDGVL
jgi:hypothetical protein